MSYTLENLEDFRTIAEYLIQIDTSKYDGNILDKAYYQEALIEQKVQTLIATQATPAALAQELDMHALLVLTSNHFRAQKPSVLEKLELITPSSPAIGRKMKEWAKMRNLKGQLAMNICTTQAKIDSKI